MFTFGFSNEKNDHLDSKLEWRNCAEVVSIDNFSITDCIKEENIKTIKLSSLVLKYLIPNGVFELLNKFDEFDDGSILKAEHIHSDLLPAIYEGIMVFRFEVI